MHRSSSTTRVSDDYLKYHSSSSAAASPSPVLRSLSLEANELPQLEPMSEASKKEKSRVKLAENAIHLIPFVLLLCALILWFFSNPEINLPIKPDSIAGRIKGLTLEGEIDGDNSEIGTVAGIDLGELDPGKLVEDRKSSSTSDNKSS
ncbi:hypothetical protein ACSBR1_008105 [Camellia fascicularis]